jgi:anti-anti-sigma factor
MQSSRYRPAGAEVADVFRVELTHQPGASRARFVGELDIATVPQLDRLIDALAARPGGDLTVDLSDLTFIDCAGLRALLEIREAVCDVGGTLILTGVSAFTRRLLRITELDEVFEIGAMDEERCS